MWRARLWVRDEIKIILWLKHFAQQLDDKLAKGASQLSTYFLQVQYNQAREQHVLKPYFWGKNGQGGGLICEIHVKLPTVLALIIRTAKKNY